MRHLFLFFFMISTWLHAQPNCDAYLYTGDTAQYEACFLAVDIANTYYQFSREFQEGMDEALKICPYFAYAYREKAAAYVKSGDFITWKKLIDQAVRYAPIDYMGIRASIRCKFFGDYEGAINDIDSLENLIDFDIGPSHDGTYHLNMVKGLCYKALGDRTKALKIVSKHIENGEYRGVYDFLHLGVLYLEVNQFEDAKAALLRQQEQNTLAENHYYLALVFKKTGELDRYKKELEIAKQLYLNGSKMHDPYSELTDEIYLSTIENELDRVIN